MRETLRRRALAAATGFAAAAAGFAAAAAGLAVAAGCSSGSAVPTSSQPSSLITSSRHVPPGMRLVRGSAAEGTFLVPLVPHPWNLPHAWPEKKKQQEVLLVADRFDNQVLMYDPKIPNPSPEGSITKGIDSPFGLAVDKKGTLYVANFLGGKPDIGSITIYKAGKTSPSLTITHGIDSPYGIAVDSLGDVFASNLSNNTIVAYKPGKQSPFETINFNSYGQPLGLATDRKNNLWVASDSNSRIYKIIAGTISPQDARLSGIDVPIGVAFTRKDIMYVSNFGAGDVTAYQYGTTTPFRTITNGIQGGDISDRSTPKPKTVVPMALSTAGPTFNGVTASHYFFQSNQGTNVVGYKGGQTSPFSTITGIPDPRGIASTPLVKK